MVQKGLDKQLLSVSILMGNSIYSMILPLKEEILIKLKSKKFIYYFIKKMNN